MGFFSRSPRYFALPRCSGILLLTFTALFLGNITPGLAQARKKSALVLVSQKSPFDGLTGDEGQAGTNYPDTELEPSMAVNPRNPHNIIAVWQQDRWDNGGCRGLVAGVSMDAGQHWKEVVIPDLTLVSGGTSYRASDPWISFGPNGEAYVVGLVFSDGLSTGIAATRSPNGGLSWSPPVILIDDLSGSVLNDKEAVTADPLDARLVYCVWDRATNTDQPVYFARSTDSGKTWEPSRLIYDPGQGNYTISNQIVVLPNHRLLDYFVEGTNAGTTISYIRSDDRGVTWTGPYVVVDKESIGAVDPNTNSGLRTGALYSIAVNPTTAALYLVWEDSRFGNAKYDSVAFMTSTDGGKRWTQPIRIDKTPKSSQNVRNQAFQPSVGIAADGTIAVTYYDFRYSSPMLKPDTDYWSIFCKPTKSAPVTDPRSWGFEQRLTDKSFNMNDAPDAGGLFVGDYQGFQGINNDFHVIFAQTSGVEKDSIYYRRLLPLGP